MSKYGVFSGPYFPVFGLNMEKYCLSFRPEKTPYLELSTQCSGLKASLKKIFLYFFQGWKSIYWFKAFSKYNSFESYTKSASFFLILRVDSIIKYFGSQCCSELNKAFGIFTQNCFYTISFILSLTFAPIFNEASNELERTNSRSTFILISVYSELLFLSLTISSLQLLFRGCYHYCGYI